MNTKEIIIFLAVLIIIALGTYATVHMNTASQPIELSTAGTSTKVISSVLYENTVEGYTVMYPENLLVNQYEDGSVGFGTTTNDIMQNKAEVQVMVVEGKKGQTLEQTTTEKLQNFCDADGPGSSIRCIGAEAIVEASTTEGLLGFSFFLRGEVENTKTNATSSITKGPFYVFPTKTSGNASKVILIYPPFNLNREETDATTVEEVAKSLQLITE